MGKQGDDMRMIQSIKWSNAGVVIFGLVLLVLIVEAINVEQIHYIVLLVIAGISSMGLAMVLLIIYNRNNNLDSNVGDEAGNDEKYYDAINDLNKISTSLTLSGEDQLVSILNLGCQYLGKSMGRISYINLKAHSNTVTKTVYSDSYKEHKGKMAAGELLFNDEDFLHFESYLSATLVVNKEFYGTVNFQCLDDGKKKVFSDADKSLVNLIGATISSVLERDVAKNIREAMFEAEVANKAKTSFIRNLSHDLRTPLTAIVGYSDLLIEDSTEQKNQKFETDLKKIRYASTHLLTLIDDILDISRIESGKTGIEYEKFAAEPVIKEVAENIRSLMRDNRINLQVKCITNLGYIYSDATKLRQLLVNLLVNAGKYTPGATIVLEVDREVCSGGEWLILKVINTEIKLGADELKSLVGHNIHSDPEVAIENVSTGLDLYISRQYCILMGGEINVDYEPDQGATFTVRLPVLQEPDSGTQSLNVSLLVDRAS